MPLVLDGSDGITQPSITTAFGLPAGTTAQRPTGVIGMIRFNTETELVEAYTGVEWSAGVDVEQAIADFAAGEPGQPRLIGQAVGLIEAYPVLTVTASSAFEVLTGAGLVISTETTVTGNTNNPPTVVGVRYVINKYTGSMRFTFFQACGRGASTASVFKDNVLVTTFVLNGFGEPQSTTRSFDTTVAVNNIIEVRHAVTGLDGSTVNTPKCFANNPYIAATLFKPAL